MNVCLQSALGTGTAAIPQKIPRQKKHSGSANSSIARARTTGVSCHVERNRGCGIHAYSSWRASTQALLERSTQALLERATELVDDEGMLRCSWGSGRAGAGTGEDDDDEWVLMWRGKALVPFRGYEL